MNKLKEYMDPNIFIFYKNFTSLIYRVVLGSQKTSTKLLNSVPNNTQEKFHLF